MFMVMRFSYSILLILLRLPTDLLRMRQMFFTMVLIQCIRIRPMKLSEVEFESPNTQPSFIECLAGYFMGRAMREGAPQGEL